MTSNIVTDVYKLINAWVTNYKNVFLFEIILW